MLDDGNFSIRLIGQTVLEHLSIILDSSNSHTLF